MHIQELEKIVSDSLADFKLDQDEKVLFKSLSTTLTEEQCRFIRNKAFELSRPFVEQGGPEAVKVHKWLERIVKSIQPSANKERVHSSAYFSPGSACRDKIIQLLREARQTIEICVFTISDNKITEAILAAARRGVRVTVISDNDKANDRGSDIDYLSAQGITVILDNTSYHMHHKFLLCDRRILLNGSFNWTRSASDVNEENLLVTDDEELVALYGQQFERLKAALSDE